MRRIACYVCHGVVEIQELAPKRCEQCGESLFINIDATVFNQEMYSTKVENVPKSTSEHKITLPTVESVMKSSLAFNDFEDLDIENSNNLAVVDFFIEPGVYSFMPRLSGGQDGTPCRIVVRNFHSEEFIDAFEAPLMPIAFENGVVIVGFEKPYELTVGCAIRVEVYTDFKSQGLTYHNMVLENSHVV